MTAGEDQPKPVVLDALIVRGCGDAGLGSELLGDSRLRRVEPGAPSHRVDGLEPSRRNEPRARTRGYSLLRPSLQRSTKGIVQCVLGQLKVAEQPNQACKDPPRLRAINGVQFLPRLFGGVFFHGHSTFPLVKNVLGLGAEALIALAWPARKFCKMFEKGAGAGAKVAEPSSLCAFLEQTETVRLHRSALVSSASPLLMLLRTSRQQSFDLSRQDIGLGSEARGASPDAFTKLLEKGACGFHPSFSRQPNHKANDRVPANKLQSVDQVRWIGLQRQNFEHGQLVVLPFRDGEENLSD